MFICQDLSPNSFPFPLDVHVSVETWMDLQTITQGEVNEKEKKQIPNIIPTFWSDLLCRTWAWSTDTYQYTVAHGSQPTKDLMLFWSLWGLSLSLPRWGMERPRRCWPHTVKITQDEKRGLLLRSSGFVIPTSPSNSRTWPGEPYCHSFFSAFKRKSIFWSKILF